MFLLLPQCMLIFPWLGKIYVLILVWQSFLLLSFLQFCYWFCLNSWDTTGASTKNILVAGRLQSVIFVESSFVHQFFHKLRRSLTSGGLFLQLIEEAPNPSNVLYPTEVKDAFWPIYVSVSNFHFQPEEWPVVLGWIQCCSDIHNRPLWNHVKWRSILCGDLSWENFHCSI